MRTLSRTIGGIGAVLALAGSVAFAGALHARLVKAEPGVGQTIAEAPKVIRLWFSEAPEVAFTSVTLMKADSTVVAKVSVTATEDKLSVSGRIATAILPGEYLVAWRTAAHDGHPVKGQYRFVFKKN